ncbi:hypothetical protein LPW11_20130 [Geomonas sp. RF6]|uniref:hypothetical protein n=1 Tax=Geomonas sp. RF6 TaxID=2897342 RepID=UPI001E3DBAF9|nr:hypothetical protein [Geomonas sp. RF6]UFS70169.1 hypothetical protein LPW11_20130 [Geomonas sp. RF6]
MKIKKEDCPRSIDMVTEDFSDKSDSTVTCTRCGASAHDPSLLCSPDVTLASSTQLREGSQSSFSSQSGQSDFQSGQSQSSQSQSQFGQSQSQFGQGQSSQGQSKNIQNQSQSNLGKSEEDVDLGE